MLISVHIPKCAGTSFRHFLHESFGESLWLNYGAIFTRDQAGMEVIPPATKCIQGHFFADAFDDLFPARTLITWLRHPVERVVSNYHHFLRSPDMRDDCCKALHRDGLNLREFAGLEWMRNEATRYMSGKPVSDFSFIGIAERFAESLDVFCRMFDFPAPKRTPRDNVNPGRTGPRYEIPPRDFDHILGLNLDDMAAYEEAAATLDTTVAGCGHSLA
jgi:hypothetical protein